MGKDPNFYANGAEEDDENTGTDGVVLKKLSKEEKEKIKKALKKKQKKQRKRNKNDDDEMEEDDILRQEMLKQPTEIPADAPATEEKSETAPAANQSTDGKKEESIEVEYVEKDEYLLTGKYYEEFKHVFQYFATPKEGTMARHEDSEESDGEDQQNRNKDGEENTDRVAEDKPLSRKKRKQQKLLKVAQLKALVKRPDLVEVWDVTAPDPLLLVYLKSYKNSVGVPRHWCQKRKFLQNKRGILKPPFRLPENIENTGIARLRDPFNDKEAGRLIRQKLRERMNPKLGKIDIDYEVLHDAFFKYPKKPKMSIHGDIYFEGREDEVKVRSYKPGRISDDLRISLGISEFAPPPWLINMQRYGPPPSYPHLKIPGVNFSMPEGGYYSLYYNKQTDENGKTTGQGFVYAFVRAPELDDADIPTEKVHWGEINEDEMEEEMQEEEDYNDNTDIRTETEIKSGISSMISGMETPDTDIRKRMPVADSVQNINLNDTSKPLYTVLEPMKANVGGNIYGSTYGYKIPGVNDQGVADKDQKSGDKEKINFKF